MASQPDPPAGGAQGGNPALWDIMFTLSVTITNTGTVAGKDVIMLFVQYPSDNPWDTPPIQLRAFAKTATLQPGTSQVVKVEVKRKDLSIWDVVRQSWVVTISSSKSFLFRVGNSSAGLTLACESLNRSCSGGRLPPV